MTITLTVELDEKVFPISNKTWLNVEIGKIWVLITEVVEIVCSCGTGL